MYRKMPAGYTLSTDERGESADKMAKILLVEDNQMNRNMLSRRLTRKVYEVVGGEDGERGVSMAASEPGHGRT